MESIKFICIDCKSTVYSWCLDAVDIEQVLVRERCAVCTWIHSMSDLTPEQVQEIRTMTATLRPLPLE